MDSPHNTHEPAVRYLARLIHYAKDLNEVGSIWEELESTVCCTMFGFTDMKTLYCDACVVRELNHNQIKRNEFHYVLPPWRPEIPMCHKCKLQPVGRLKTRDNCVHCILSLWAKKTAPPMYLFREDQVKEQSNISPRSSSEPVGVASIELTAPAHEMPALTPEKRIPSKNSIETVIEILLNDDGSIVSCSSTVHKTSTTNQQRRVESEGEEDSSEAASSGIGSPPPSYEELRSETESSNDDN